MRPPILSDEPVAFVLNAARHDLLTRQPNLRGRGRLMPNVQEQIIACLAGQLYGDALVLAMLLEDDIRGAKQTEQEMFHEPR